METTKQIDKDRRFIISLCLADNEISVFEPKTSNNYSKLGDTGITGGKFLDKRAIQKEGTEDFFTSQDFYIGAKLDFYHHKFVILDADIYALNIHALNITF